MNVLLWLIWLYQRIFRRYTSRPVNRGSQPMYPCYEMTSPGEAPKVTIDAYDEENDVYSYTVRTGDPESLDLGPLPEPGYNALRGPYGEPSGGDIADVPGLRWQEAMRIPPPGVVHADDLYTMVPEDFQNPKNGHRP